MITLENLSSILQEGLANALEADPIVFKYGQGQSERTEQYQIAVDYDTAEYIPSVREGNTVTHYIQGLLLERGSTIEVTNTQSFNGTISAEMQILVPVLEDKLDNLTLVEKFRDILTNYLAVNKIQNVDGYSVATMYNLATSGLRQQIQQIGDAFTFIVQMDFYIIQGGVNSSGIKMYFNGGPENGKQVDYIAFGMRRVATQENNVEGNPRAMIGSFPPTSKTLTDSTALVIRVTAPLLYNGSVAEFGINALTALRIGGTDIGPYAVYIEFDLGKDIDGNRMITGSYYNMVFSDVALNAEGTKNASVEVTLTEEMVVD